MLQREINLFTSNVIPSTVALIAGIAGLLIFSLITIITKKKSNDDIKFDIAACIVILAGAVLFFGASIFIYSVLTFFAGKKSKPVEEKIESEPLEAVQEEEEPVYDPEEDAEKQMQNEVLKAGRDFMVKASESFSDSDGLLKLLDTINKSVIDITKSDGGAILLIDEFDDIITVKTFTASTGFAAQNCAC